MFNTENVIEQMSMFMCDDKTIATNFKGKF